eukprot:1187027-Rhodomonas_salina.2
MTPVSLPTLCVARHELDIRPETHRLVLGDHLIHAALAGGLLHDELEETVVRGVTQPPFRACGLCINDVDRTQNMMLLRALGRQRIRTHPREGPPPVENEPLWLTSSHNLLHTNPLRQL